MKGAKITFESDCKATHKKTISTLVTRQGTRIAYGLNKVCVPVAGIIKTIWHLSQTEV